LTLVLPRKITYNLSHHPLETQYFPLSPDETSSRSGLVDRTDHDGTFTVAASVRKRPSGDERLVPAEDAAA
jgi:hypothetical protein